MNERVEEIRRKFYTTFPNPDVLTGETATAIRDLLAALAQAEREREEDIAELNRALAVEVEAVALALAALAQAEREGDEARAERNARARDVMHLEAENERLRGYSDALKGQRDRAEDRTRVLEAALAEMGNAMEAGAYDAAWVIRNAALTEPTPPQEEPR